MEATINKTKSRIGNKKKSVQAKVPGKAYELYEKRGHEHGRDLDDWFEAEKIVEEKMITEGSKRTQI